MGYKLRKREYDYNESLFKEIGIQVQEVEGRNFLEPVRDLKKGIE
ncbi:hypothetical protein [Wolbachia endosymbiont (group B) of Xanthorhoe designata]